MFSLKGQSAISLVNLVILRLAKEEFLSNVSKGIMFDLAPNSLRENNKNEKWMTESVEDLNFDLGSERVDLLLLTKCFQCLFTASFKTI